MPEDELLKVLAKALSELASQRAVAKVLGVSKETIARDLDLRGTNVPATTKKNNDNKEEQIAGGTNVPAQAAFQEDVDPYKLAKSRQHSPPKARTIGRQHEAAATAGHATRRGGLNRLRGLNDKGELVARSYVPHFRDRRKIYRKYTRTLGLQYVSKYVIAASESLAFRFLNVPVICVDPIAVACLRTRLLNLTLLNVSISVFDDFRTMFFGSVKPQTSTVLVMLGFDFLIEMDRNA